MISAVGAVAWNLATWKGRNALLECGMEELGLQLRDRIGRMRRWQLWRRVGWFEIEVEVEANANTLPNATAYRVPNSSAPCHFLPRELFAS